MEQQEQRQHAIEQAEQVEQEPSNF